MVETLRGNPGKWALLLPDSPISLCVAINNRSMTALQTTDGVVRVKRRETHLDERGKKRANLWMAFVPDGWVQEEDGTWVPPEGQT